MRPRTPLKRLLALSGGCETDRWSPTQIMGQCPEALGLDDPLATEAQYF